MAGSVATALLMLWFVTAGDTASAAWQRSDPDALRLLSDAAGAAQRTPFQGVQFVVAWSRSGSGTTSLVDVTHTPGRGTEMQVQRTTADQGETMFEADDPGRPRGGLAGYTPKMLDLLSRNYAVVHAGDGTVCGRAAYIVEARRGDGTAAGRFYIDEGTGMLLRRELLDQQGREVDLTMFTELKLSDPAPVVQQVAAQATVEVPWAHELAQADLGALRGRGWPIDATLPGGLSLFDARQLDGHDSVVHLGYTDGLSVVSVFVQRGVLDRRSVAGWQLTTRSGRGVYVRDTVQQQVIWASRGYVYTIVADAPPETVDAAVAALPHGEPGFWTRLHTGLDRLTSWADPFS
jgi:MucB/RseB N-terminal domain